MIAQSGVERDQDLIHPILPPLPFGFVFAPHVAKGSTSGPTYIVPAEVVERRDVPAWRFDFRPWGNANNRHGNYHWFYVTNAEPWQPSTR